jgi:hypothetical protein
LNPQAAGGAVVEPLIPSATIKNADPSNPALSEMERQRQAQQDLAEFNSLSDEERDWLASQHGIHDAKTWAMNGKPQRSSGSPTKPLGPSGFDISAAIGTAWRELWDDLQGSKLATLIKQAMSDQSNGPGNGEASGWELVLSKGKVTQKLFEELRMVPLDSNEAKVFHREVSKLAKRLYPDHDLDAQPVIFFLMDTPYPNALYLTDSDPSMIGFSRTLFLPFKHGEKIHPPLVDTWDKLAAILRHERFHLWVDKRFGKTANSKLEEGLADVYDLEVLENAGLDAKEMLVLAQRIAKISSEFERDFWSTIVDPHPTDTSRVAIVEGALAKLDNQRGGLHNRPTPFTDNDALIQSVQSASHVPYVRSQLAARHFDQASAPDKWRILAELVASTEAYNKARIDDLENEITKLALDTTNADEMGALDQLADAILSAFGRKGFPATHLYARVATKVVKREFVYPPLGRLKRISGAIHDFIQSDSPTTMKEKAGAFLDALIDEPLMRSKDGLTFLADHILWPSFPPTDLENNIDAKYYFKPDEERVKIVASDLKRLRKDHSRDFFEDGDYRLTVFWNRFVEAASRYGEDNTIVKALLVLGINDPRLLTTRLVSPSLASDILNQKLPCISQFGFGDYVIRAYRDANDDDDLKIESLSLSLTLATYEQYLWISGQSKEFKQQISEGFVEKTDQLRLRRDIATQKGEGAESITTWDEAYIDPLNFVRRHEAELASVPQHATHICRVFVELLSSKGEEATTRNAIREAFQGRNLHTLFGAERRIIGDLGQVKGRRDTNRLDKRENPYLKFILDQSGNLFSNREKLELLTGLIYFVGAPGEEGLTGEQDVSQASLEYFMESAFPLLTQEFPEIFSIRHPTWNDLTAVLALPEAGKPPAKEFVVTQMACLVFETKPTYSQTLQIIQFLGVKDLKYVKERFAELHNAIMLINNDPEKIGGRASLDDLMNHWSILRQVEILNPKSDHALLERLIEAVGKVREPARRKEFATRLLTSGRILNPTLRAAVFDQWVAILREQYGVDDESQAYSDAILSEVKGVLEPMDRVDNVEVLSRLCRALQTQRALTYKLRRLLPKLEKKDFEQGLLAGIVSNYALETLKGHPDRKLALLEFFLTQVSRQSIDRLIEVAGKFWSVSAVIDEYYENARKGPPTDTEKKIKALQDEKDRQLLEMLHQNFWAAPLAVRAILAKELLLSGEESDDTRDQRVFSYVIDKILGDDSGNAAIREILEAYVAALPSYVRHLYLTAMMVAAEKRSEGAFRLGQALAALAENLGPAETKVAQAAESHPDVDADIRIDLQRLKMHADEPFRWEIQEWIDKNLPPSLLRQIKRLGNVLGSGSLYVVVELEMMDDTVVVLALLRPFAEQRAANGFDIMSRAVNQLKSDHPHLETLLELLEQGKRQTRLETDFELVVPQYAKAHEIYQGATITMSGQTFHFSVPSILTHGPRFRLMEKAPGEHFLDLPEATEAERAYKRELAMAILTMELNNIVTGLPFDNDRHGGNIRVSDHTIHHFDLGAMVLEPASDADYAQLTEVLYNAIRNTSSVRDFGETILQEIRKIRDTGAEVSDLVVRVQKALLSLGDYLVFLSAEDLKRVIYSACTQGKIHPAIRQTIMGKVAKSFWSNPLASIQKIVSGQGITLNIDLNIQPDQIIVIKR